MTYGEAYRTEMTGEFIHVDHGRRGRQYLFNVGPLLPAGRRHGSDRWHGLSRSTFQQAAGLERISEMTLLARPARQIDPSKTYQSSRAGPRVNEGTEGPQIWDVVESHIRKIGHGSQSNRMKT